MEISENIKSRIFAQYFGATVFGDLQDSEYINQAEFQMDYDNFEFCVAENIHLVLYPISKISDEDALELSRVAMPKSDWMHSKISGRDIAQTIDKGRSWNFYYEGADWIAAYNFLVQRFYDVPNYYVNGRKLAEVGLAVYKEKEESIKQDSENLN
jgi:hypothetical protein